MPEMGGNQLVEAVQQKFPEIKILIISGYGDEPNLTTGDKKFKYQKLIKPYKSEDMLTQVRILLDEERDS